jgi:hypothetical protein
LLLFEKEKTVKYFGFYDYSHIIVIVKQAQDSYFIVKIIHLRFTFNLQTLSFLLRRVL